MTMPRHLRVNAKARPGALPMPADRKVSAFAPANVYDRWGDEAAGIRVAASTVEDGRHQGLVLGEEVVAQRGARQ